MTKQIYIGIDMMGGDNAPECNIKAVKETHKNKANVTIKCYGQAEKLTELNGLENVEIIDCREENLMEDGAIAIRKKKDSPVARAMEDIKSGITDAFISNGSTGSVLGGAVLILRNIPGVERPGLATVWPNTKRGDYSIFLDVGANVDCKPENLLNFGIMGSIYSQITRDVANPKVGLMNVGTEDGKGSVLYKEAFYLLKDAPINFCGNMEARYAMDTDMHVIVADGGYGNMVLKSFEGAGKMSKTLVMDAIYSNIFTKIAGALLKSKLEEKLAPFDHKTFPGAILLGVNGLVYKGHGSSDHRSMITSINEATKAVENDLLAKLKEATKKDD